MRIASYNVWNENKGMGNRFQQLIQEIVSVDADIIALQEVTPKFFEVHLLPKAGYAHCVYQQYREQEEGLAILSKHPIQKSFFLNTSKEFAFSAALNVLCTADGIRFSVTDVHLPWDSARAKEQQITAIDRYIHGQKEQADFFILLGDFNTGLQSSVHRYLQGEQTVDNQEANPYWVELTSAYAQIHHVPLKPTLDIANNPRWNGKNTRTIYTSDAFDRIYIMDTWGDVELKSADIFGTAVSPENGLAASDHYGVVVDAAFAK